MSDHATDPVSPELVAWWWVRYRRLVELMQRRPGDASHWVWEVRRGVLAYLLRRYGSEVTVEELARMEPVEPRRSAGGVARPAAWPCRPAPGSGAPPRGASAFREKLEHVRQLNVDRPETVTGVVPEPPPQERVRRLSYPEDGYELPGEALLTEERAVLAREAEAIGRLIPGGRPLTEDEVVAVLTGVAG